MRQAGKYIIGLLFVAALASALCLALYHWDNKYTHTGTQPINGVLTLSEDEAGDARFLIDDWRLYPNVLLTPEEYSASGNSSYMVYTAIGERTNFSTGMSDDPHGSATYALTLNLPETPATYALLMPEVFSAYCLYLDDKLLVEVGDPYPLSYTPRTQERMVTFEGSGSHTLLLTVSDYSHFYSGMVYPPTFGSLESVNYIRGARLGLCLIIGLLGLSVAAIGLYMGVRMNYKESFLFALLCLTSAVYTAYPLIHSMFELSIQPWYALEIFCSYAMTLLVVILQSDLCGVPQRLRRAVVAIGAGFCLLALGYGLFSAQLTVPMITAFSHLSNAFKLGAAAYLVVVALDALQRHTMRSMRLFYAAFFYTMLLVWDRLLPAYEPIIVGWFSEWGSMLLIVVVGSCMWHELMSSYAQRTTFAEEHRQMERQLLMQMEYSGQIRERTDENRRLIHDFRQQLRTITAMSTQIDSTPETSAAQQELLHYLDELPRTSLQTTTAPMGYFCNRAAVDALLQYYNVAAQHQGVEARLSLHIPDDIPLSDIDWCSVLGNLLENALEACARMTEGDKLLVMTTQQTPTTFFVKVENTYDGHYRQQGRRFISRKTDTVRLGVGLESVRDIVTRCGGDVDIYPGERIFSVGLTLPVKKS